MRFLLDQDVPDDVEFSLAALGHTLIKLRDVLPGTTPDREVLRAALERDAVHLFDCNSPPASLPFLQPLGRVTE